MNQCNVMITPIVFKTALWCIPYDTTNGVKSIGRGNLPTERYVPQLGNRRPAYMHGLVRQGRLQQSMQVHDFGAGAENLNHLLYSWKVRADQQGLEKLHQGHVEPLAPVEGQLINQLANDVNSPDKEGVLKTGAPLDY